MSEREVLAKFEAPTTVKEAGATQYRLKTFLERGLLKSAGTYATGTRGRPAKLYTLTAKGQKAIAA